MAYIILRVLWRIFPILKAHELFRIEDDESAKNERTRIIATFTNLIYCGWNYGCTGRKAEVCVSVASMRL